MKTKIIAFSLIATLIGIVGITNMVFAASPDLVGRWNLNDNSGNIAKDTSGNNLDGNVVNTSLVKGKYGNAYSFNNDGYIQISNNSVLEPTNISIESWVKASSSPGIYKYIVSKGANGDNNASYALYTGTSGGLEFYISQGNNFILSPDAGTNIWDGNWHHVTGTYDGSTIRLYVDQKEIANGTSTNIPISYNLPDGNDLYIGTYNGTVVHGFQGQIDEVRIWNRALSPTEISQHAQSNSSATFPYSE